MIIIDKQVKVLVVFVAIIFIFSVFGVMYIVKDGLKTSKSSQEPIEIIKQDKFTSENINELKGQILVLQNKVEDLEFETDKQKVIAEEWKIYWDIVFGRGN